MLYLLEVAIGDRLVAFDLYTSRERFEDAFLALSNRLSDHDDNTVIRGIHICI